MTISYSKSKNKRFNGLPEEHKQLMQIVLDDPHWGQEFVRSFIGKPNITLLSHSIPKEKTTLYGFSLRMKAVARDMDGKLYNVRILWQEESNAYKNLNDLIDYYDAERSMDHELVIVTIIEDESAFPPGISCTRVIYPDKHLIKVELNRPHFDAENFAAVNITIRKEKTENHVNRHMS